MTGTPSVEEILGLLIPRVAAVMAIASDQITPTARFGEDLHADSLDLVEIVESVEQALRDRGLVCALPDDALLGLDTVGDAARAIAGEVSSG